MTRRDGPSRAGATLGVRIYKLLLHAYPAAFRKRFGADLVRHVDSESREVEAASLPRLRFWAGVGWDLAKSAFRLHGTRTAEDLRFLATDLSRTAHYFRRPRSTTPFLGGCMSTPVPYRTANERFKQSFSTTLWTSLILATVAHFALLNFFPELQAEIWSDQVEEPPEFTPIKEYDVPEPPAPVVRPATPIISPGMDELEITIGENTKLQDWEPEELAPRVRVDEVEDEPGFTPYDLAPRMKNRREVSRALVREYPDILRDAGIGGTVVVWLYIDEEGVVQRFKVHSPSAHESLNQAALRVVGVAEFSPAQNMDQPTAVWVQFPVTFQVR